MIRFDTKGNSPTSVVSLSGFHRMSLDVTGDWMSLGVTSGGHWGV